MFLCSGNALWMIRPELATRLQHLLLPPPTRATTSRACCHLRKLMPPPELAAARSLASRIEAWPKADLLQDVQSSKNLRCPATDNVIRLWPADHRYSTCSEPDPTTTSYSHPTDRPTDHRCSTCSEPDDDGIIFPPDRQTDRLTRPTCKARREPRPDLPAKHEVNPDMA